MRRRPPRALAALALLPVLAACGAQGGGERPEAGACGAREELPERLPPFPEPAQSPPLTEKPAGRVLPLPGRPEGLAFDKRTAQVAVGVNDPRGLIVFLDARTGGERRRVPLAGGPRHLRFERPGGSLLVPAEDANALIRVPPGGGRVTSTPVGRQPHDATAASGGRIFVINEGDSSMSVIARDRVICTLPTPANPGGVAAAEGGERVGAVGVRANTLRVYDARNLRGLAEVGVGVGPTHVVSNGRRRMYVADTRGDAIIFLRTRPLEVIGRAALPDSAPYGLAYDDRRSELWVTSTQKNRVVLFRGGERVRSFPTVRQPNSVTLDTRTGRVFVGGRYEQLQVIDPPQDEP